MSREPGGGRDLGTSPLVAALLGACILGLLAALAFSYIGQRRTGDRLAVLEEYVQGRGEYRDAEAKRIEEENAELVRRSACEILDALPAGDVLLDEVRAEFQCGPGRPVLDFPPEVQAELVPQAAAIPPPPPPAVVRPSSPLDVPPPRTLPSPSPSVGPAAAPAPDRPAAPPVAEPEPSAAPAPPPSPEPAPAEPEPLLNLEPVTEPLCAVLGVCL